MCAHPSTVRRATSSSSPRSCRAARTGLFALDLYLIHWPNPRLGRGNDLLERPEIVDIAAITALGRPGGRLADQEPTVYEEL